MSGLTQTIIIKKFDIISLSEKCEVVQTRDHLPMIPRGISCCGGVFFALRFLLRKNLPSVLCFGVSDLRSLQKVAVPGFRSGAR